jgi:hypothetical protein
VSWSWIRLRDHAEGFLRFVLRNNAEMLRVLLGFC